MPSSLKQLNMCKDFAANLVERMIAAPSINQVTKQSFLRNDQVSEKKPVTKVKIL